LAQKQLLTEMPSPAIMLFVYVGSAICSSVAAHPTTLGALTGVGVALLIFTAANTIVAYGAFAEALAHWEASRVSAVLALTPIVTIMTMHAGHWLWPDVVAHEPLPAISYLGAALVVAGSMMASLARQPGRTSKPPEWRGVPQVTD
jgi:drug/metabolite transporter (DMT)-like permease